jgi:uncharacterized membrane protein
MTSVVLRRPRNSLYAGSLALNVFLVALIAMFLLRPLLGWGGHHGPADPMERLAEALPADDAARFRGVLDHERPAYQPARDRILGTHMAVADAIAQSPYDRSRLVDALGAWQQSWLQFTTTFNATFLNAVGSLSDAGRARLAEAIREDDRRRQEVVSHARGTEPPNR